MPTVYIYVEGMWVLQIHRAKEVGVSNDVTSRNSNSKSGLRDPLSCRRFQRLFSAHEFFVAAEFRLERRSLAKREVSVAQLSYTITPRKRSENLPFSRNLVTTERKRRGHRVE